MNRLAIIELQRWGFPGVTKMEPWSYVEELKISTNLWRFVTYQTQKLRPQRILVKTTSISGHLWSAIFSAIVYWHLVLHPRNQRHAKQVISRNHLQCNSANHSPKFARPILLSINLFPVVLKRAKYCQYLQNDSVHRNQLSSGPQTMNFELSKRARGQNRPMKKQGILVGITRTRNQGIKAVSYNLICCIKMLNWDLLCRVNIMSQRAYSCVKIHSPCRTVPSQFSMLIQLVVWCEAVLTL